MSNLKKTEAPSSIHHLLRIAAHQIHTPEREYLSFKKDGKWETLTFGQVLEDAQAFSAQLLNMGFEKGDRFAFLMDNHPYYFIADQGLQQIGCVNVSIYPTLSDEEAAFIYQDSGSTAILVGNHFLLKRIKRIFPKLPLCKKVICLFEDVSKVWDDPVVVSLNSFIQEGKKLIPTFHDLIEERFQSVHHQDLASFIYTSGTTGNPKGAMLTHGNFLSNCESGLTLISEFSHEEKMLSFLPLSHVYERTVTYYMCLYRGGQVAFAESMDKIATNIGETQPSILATVPRLLERIEEKVKKNVEQKGGLSFAIFNWALKQGMKKNHLENNGKRIGVGLKIAYRIADRLVFSKVKARLGGNIKFIVSGGAALPVHVAEFFGGIGIKVLEGYGLTETSPFISVNEYHRQIFGTVGRVGPGQIVRIQHPENGSVLAEQTFDTFHPTFESEEGEILMKGPNLMQGYWQMPEETKHVIDKDGWFHTGDIGKFFQGNLKITDRIKNIIVNAYGKNIYPTQVENVYLVSRKIEQIFIIGDRRDYLTAIIVPSKDEIMEFFGKSESWFQNENPWIEEAEILDWIQSDIKRNGQHLAKFERIKAFILKRQPFSVENGEMTPKQSIKRKVVELKYAKEIENMYAQNLTEED